MKVNKYTKLKNGMYKIYLDNFDIEVHENLILKYNLLIKKELNEKELKQILLENKTYEIYNIALKFLKSKLRSIYEVEQKISTESVDKKNIDEAINILKREGYLDDSKFAYYYILDKIKLSEDGPLKIKNDLKNKYGINDIDILNNIDNFTIEKQKEKLEKIVNKYIKYNRNNSLIMLKNKIKTNLYRLGYDYSLIDNYINKININDSSIYDKQVLKLRKQLSRKYSGEELEKKIKEKLYMKGFKQFN